MGANGVVVGTDAGLFEVGGDGPALAEHRITALARAASDPTRWWVVLDGQEVRRSEDAVRWDRAASLGEYLGRSVLPTSFGLLVGTSEAHLLRFRDGSLEAVEAFDRVRGRENWYTPWGGPPDTRSLSAGPDGAIYANVHVGGIPRSSDGGATWEPTIEVDADVHQVLAHPERVGLVLAATASGLALSRDGGDTWSFHRDGLHAAYSRAVALAGNTVLLTVSRGPRGGEAAVYRRPVDEDRPFERCRDGLPDWFSGNIDTACLAASGDRAAFGTDEGSVFLSTDSGATWDRVADGLPPVRGVVLA